MSRTVLARKAVTLFGRPGFAVLESICCPHAASAVDISTPRAASCCWEQSGAPDLYFPVSTPGSVASLIGAGELPLMSVSAAAGAASPAGKSSSATDLAYLSVVALTGAVIYGVEQESMVFASSDPRSGAYIGVVKKQTESADNVPNGSEDDPPGNDSARRSIEVMERLLQEIIEERARLSEEKEEHSEEVRRSEADLAKKEEQLLREYSRKQAEMADERKVLDVGKRCLDDDRRKYHDEREKLHEDRLKYGPPPKEEDGPLTKLLRRVELVLGIRGRLIAVKDKASELSAFVIFLVSGGGLIMGSLKSGTATVDFLKWLEKTREEIRKDARAKVDGSVAGQRPNFCPRCGQELPIIVPCRCTAPSSPSSNASPPSPSPPTPSSPKSA